MELEGVAVKKRKMNTELNILDLPDEVLIDIFNHLPLLDLSSTCQTCKRFQAVSLYTFSRNYKPIQVLVRSTGYYNISSPDKDLKEKRCDSNKLTTILQCFGNSIESLYLSNEEERYSNVAPHLDLVNTYATENLKHLRFIYVLGGGMDWLNGFAQLFGRLEKLEFHHCFLITAELGKLLTRCECLKELSLILFTIVDRSILFSITPKIEKLLCRGFRVLDCSISSEDSCEFFKTHSNLKSIQINNMTLPKMNDFKYLENLEALSMNASCAKDFDTMDWIGLFQLRSLKQLKLIADGIFRTYIFLKIEFKPPTDIESFTIQPLDFEDACNVLNAFTFRNLKKLVFLLTCDIDLEVAENQVKNLAKNLVNVVELRFQCFDDTLTLAIYFIKYFKGLKILVLDPFDYITAENLIQIADAQSNKNDKLIVKCVRGLDKTAKQALKENPGKFSMLDIISCRKIKIDYFCFSE